MSRSLPPLLSRLRDADGLPDGIPGLSLEEKQTLAQELRDEIIGVVAHNGGHLAPSLGVVELTLALLSVFDARRDPIIWDVGHQSYPWKILTGRADRFETLRRYGGISGFPRREESPCDHFGVGHASTSVSAALGMAVARDLRGGDEHVTAVIGDGALTGGLALEALNQAGGMGRRLIVILNDNGMSISKNVGAISLFLSRNLSRHGVMRLKNRMGDAMRSVPKVGDWLLDTVRRGETSFKSFFTPGMLYEAFGINYIGPVDGHDIAKLERHLEAAKVLDKPVLLHVRTRKGRGYTPAEENPSRFHGISRFDLQTGRSISAPLPSDDYSGPGFTPAFASALCDLAEQDERIVAITAAMPDGTGTSMFPPVSSTWASARSMPSRLRRGWPHAACARWWPSIPPSSSGPMIRSSMTSACRSCPSPSALTGRDWWEKTAPPIMAPLISPGCGPCPDFRSSLRATSWICATALPPP